MGDRAWRLVATGAGFVIFGLGGIAMTVGVFPFVALATPSKPRRIQRTRFLIHLSFRVFVWLLETLGVFEVDVVGRKRLGSCRGRLIVANHPCLLDVVLLIAINPRTQCIVKHQLWRNVFLRGVVVWADFIRNDLESEALLERCAKALEAGDNLLVFPEGTRTVPGREIRLQRGFANIAILARAGIQTVIIDCDQPFLCKGYPWYRVPKKKVRFRITASECWEVTDFLESPHRSLNARRLLRSLQAFYRERLSNEWSGRSDQGADRRDAETRGNLA